MSVHVSECEFVFASVWAYIYMCVGFFIVPGGYGFGKANLGLRALGPCQAHQPISYAICYGMATAYMHTCTSTQTASNPTPTQGPFPENSSSFTSDFSYEMRRTELVLSLQISCHIIAAYFLMSLTHPAYYSVNSPSMLISSLKYPWI